MLDAWKPAIDVQSLGKHMEGSQGEGLHIGDQSVHPAQSAAVLIEDPEMVVIPLAQRGPKGPEGIAVDLAIGTNCLLDDGTD